MPSGLSLSMGVLIGRGWMIARGFGVCQSRLMYAQHHLVEGMIFAVVCHVYNEESCCCVLYSLCTDGWRADLYLTHSLFSAVLMQLLKAALEGGWKGWVEGQAIVWCLLLHKGTDGRKLN